MTRTKRHKKTVKKSAAAGKPRGKYTAGEWFIAILGGALLVLFLGIIITTMFGE